MERISSRQNPVVSRFRDAARARGGEWMLLDGEHLLEEALASGTALDVVAFDDAYIDATLAFRAEAAGARTISVTPGVLAALSPVRTPSGVVALARRPACSMDVVFRGEPQFVLLLSGVQDPGNVGAIVRAAEACGVTGLVATAGCADPFGWKALRGSMGSALRVPIAGAADMADVVALAKARGARVFATVPRGGALLRDCDLRQPAAIMLGGEGAGLAADLLRLADEPPSIPMNAPVESLNVSVAAALIAYEAARQRS